MAFEALQGLPRPARGTHGSLVAALRFVLFFVWFVLFFGLVRFLFLCGVLLGVLVLRDSALDYVSVLQQFTFAATTGTAFA